MGLNLSKQDLTGRGFAGESLAGSSFAHSTISSVDFSGADLAGSNFVLCKGSGANFSRANVSDCTFERAEESVLRSLVGATWRGQEISHVSGWISTDFYWSFATDAFVTIGCMTRPLQEWEEIGRDLETLRVLHDEQPLIDLPRTLAWWRENREAIVRTVHSFGN